MAIKHFKQNDNNLAIAYYRYSSESQSASSIEQQKKYAHEYAERYGLTIVKEYSDSAQTGTDTNRLGYQTMLHEVKIIRPSVLILWAVDRLNRDITDFFVGRREIMNAGCRLRFVSQTNIDDEDDELLLLALNASNAQTYSTRLSKHIGRGQEEVAESALYPGIKIFGYTTESTSIMGKNRTFRKRYIIDKNTAPIVKRIFEEYADGVPMAEICKELNSQGFTTAKGGPFNINGMRHILENEAYIGVYKYKGYTVPGGMPIIIDKNLFERVQARLVQNKRNGSRRAKELNGDFDEAPRYWLTGKVFCGHCGASMQGVSGTSKTRGRKHYYYYCKNQRAHKCKKKPVRKEYIEDIVLKILRYIQEDGEAIASLAVDLAEQINSENQYNKDKLRMLQDAKKDTEKKLDNLLQAVMAGVFNDTTQAAMLELEKKKKMLTDEIEVEKRMQSLAGDAANIQLLFEQYSKEDINDPVVRDYILEYYIDKIYLYDDKIVFTVDYGSGRVNDVTWELVDGAVKEGEDVVVRVVEEDEDIVDSAITEGSTASSSSPPCKSLCLYRRRFLHGFDMRVEPEGF